MADVLPGLARIDAGHQMNMNITYAHWMLITGILMMITGMLHIHSQFARWDTRSFYVLHIRLNRLSPMFQYLRPLGTVPVTILMILIMYIPSWEIGIITTICFVSASIFERMIKFIVRRTRPFQVLSEVKMGQLPEPYDPSHPSGDSFRVWFLAVLFPIAFSLPVSPFIFSFLVAIILSLGRIALGVHYPLDVISGAGLGILTSSIVVISFQMIMN